MIQILDEGSPFGVTLTYELTNMVGDSPKAATHLTKKAHKELGSDIDYFKLVRLFEWLSHQDQMATIDIDEDDFPIGHPLPILFCKGGSRYTIQLGPRTEEGRLITVREGGREDRFLALQVEREFQGRALSESFIKESFEWLEKGFPNLWDHLLD